MPPAYDNPPAATQAGTQFPVSYARLALATTYQQGSRGDGMAAGARRSCGSTSSNSAN
jgi:hypothetical protein